MTMALALIVVGIITAFVQAGVLYLAIKVCKQETTFKAALAITFSVLVVNLILTFILPSGFLPSLISWLALIFLIKKWTSVDDIWPTAILISVVCGILQVLLNFLLMLLAAGLFAIGTAAA